MMSKKVGRNDPCPCGSGRKHKRCCGADPSAFATQENAPAGEDLSGKKKKLKKGAVTEEMQQMANQMDPQLMEKMAKAFQRLPKGKAIQFQGLMQKAMMGKDVSRQMESLTRTLPPEFHHLMAQMAGGMAPQEEAEQEESGSQGEMTEEEARKLVEEARDQGILDQQEAGDLLSGEKKEKKGFSKFLGKLKGH